MAHEVQCKNNIIVVLFLANCGHPELQLLSTNDSVPRRPRVDGSDDILPLEGNTISFSCPPGLALIGPNSVTCTENGEWEPDPRRLLCAGKSCNVLHLL